jgi:hypothetical protein
LDLDFFPIVIFLDFVVCILGIMLPEALKTKVIESRLMSEMEGALGPGADSNEKWIDDTAR